MKSNLPTLTLSLTAMVVMTFAPVSGAVLVKIFEDGENLVMAGSGTINTAALPSPRPGQGSFQSGELTDGANFILGEGASDFHAPDLRWSRPELPRIPEEIFIPGFPDPFPGPKRIGIFNQIEATSNFGDVIGIQGLTSGFYVYVPVNYTSGTPISGSSTFANQSLESLQLKTASYTWTWGEGASADSLTLQIVPEASISSLVAIAALGVLMIRQRLPRQNPRVREGLSPRESLGASREEG